MKSQLGIELSVGDIEIPLLPTIIVGKTATGKTRLLTKLIEQLQLMGVETVQYDKKISPYAITQEIKIRNKGSKPVVVFVDDVCDIDSEIKQLLSLEAFERGIIGIVATQNKCILRGITSMAVNHIEMFNAVNELTHYTALIGIPEDSCQYVHHYRKTCIN